MDKTPGGACGVMAEESLGWVDSSEAHQDSRVARGRETEEETDRE